MDKKIASEVKPLVSHTVKIMGDSRQGGSGEWTVSAGDLPRLLRCRARLVWRYAGEGAWRDEFLPLPEVAGKSFRFNLRGTATAIALAGSEHSNGGWEFGGRLTNTGNRPIELARFHYLDGIVEDSDKVALLYLVSLYSGTACRGFRLGQEIPPIRTPKGNPEIWWNRATQESLLPDPIYDAPNWICALDSGVFFRNANEPGWVLGAAGPGTAFGEIGFRTAGPAAGHFYAGQLLDNILLGPGETRELERLLILAGDWQAGLREWAFTCARAMGGAKPLKLPLSGFCSWYRNFCEITRADIDKAIEEFAELPVPPGGRMIQIDDGWERSPGDWKPNARFPEDWWRQLPGRIAASGSVPALYFTPLTVLETHPIVKEHPEWFQRLADGSFAERMMNWGWCDDPSWQFATRGGRLTYNLDPGHPGAREFIRAFLQDAVAAGWRAFKFDFITYIAARVAYDRRKTTFETQRDEFRLYREAAGPNVVINACVGFPARFALGYADSARIAGDMVGNWGTMRHLLPMVLLRMLVTNGIWWSADPDVFTMRGKNVTITGSYFDPVTLSTSVEEQSLLLTVQGMMGGVLYTSDLPSEWSAAARQKVLEFWGEDKPCPAENPRLAFDPQTDLPSACKVERMIAGRRRIQCALFNWSDEPQTLSVKLSELGLAPDQNWSLLPSAAGVRLQEGQLVSTQPPHSARLASLSAADA